MHMLREATINMFTRCFLLLTAISVVAPAAVRAEEKVDYEKQIQPIFVQHCAGCHGEKMASAKLRLHTVAGLQEKWKADAELIVAGKPDESELYKRLVLPADDKKRMPKKADPLPKETTDLIAKWISEGATLPAQPPVPPETPPTPTDKPAEAPAAEKPAEVPLPEVAPAPKEAIDALSAAGAQVMPLFAESPLLQVSFAHRSEPAGDAEVALLTPVAEQVYALNLAGTKTTDAGLAPLAALKNLAVLHLERSAVTDAWLAHVAGLANLQYLNLFGTGITDEGLKHLANLKHLQRLYLWQTKASYDVAMNMEKATPGLMVNLGYNHPMVMKIRLTKELEVVKKQSEEAKAEETKAQQQLEAAKKNAETVNARLADVEKQLKELETPAPTPEEKAAADAKAAEEKAAADKAAADKAAAEKAEADKAAAEVKAAEEAKATEAKPAEAANE
jgi:mono/diheme cytochrome c family protein